MKVICSSFLNCEEIRKLFFLSWPSFWREISTCLSKMSLGKLNKQLDRFETEFHLNNHENRHRKAFLMSDSKGNYLQSRGTRAGYF